MSLSFKKPSHYNNLMKVNSSRMSVVKGLSCTPLHYLSFSSHLTSFPNKPTNEISIPCGFTMDMN